MAILVVSSDNKTNFDGQGTVYATGDATYATVHNAAGNFNTNYNTWHTVGQRYNQSSDGKYRIFRAFMRFDLTNLSANKTISSAIMTILAGTQLGSYTAWSLVLVDGSDATDPLVAADYGDLLDDTTSLGSIVASTIVASTTFTITLNAAGRAFLESKAGSVAVFGVRSSDDIGNIAPTGDFIANEKTEAQFTIIDGTDFPYITINESFPSDPVTRVTSLTHRYNRFTAEYNLEIGLGEVDVGFAIPRVEWGGTSADTTKEESEAQDEKDRVVKEVKKAGAKPVVEIRGITEFEYQEGKRRGEPGALTARTLEVLATRQKEIQKLEKRQAPTRLETGMIASERTKRIIAESPEAKRRLAEIQQERKQWWEFWK